VAQNIKYKKFKKGFTFIELILVLAITAILMAASAPFYSRFILQNSVSNAQDRFVAAIHKAQSYAMAGKDDSAWSVSFSGNQVLMTRVSDNTVFDSFNLDQNTQISNFSSVTFSKLLGQPDQTFNMTITNRGQVRNISMNSQGVLSE
jgi:prepilin-type N-terminal cleavage/methylation domain-containing protein